LSESSVRGRMVDANVEEYRFNLWEVIDGSEAGRGQCLKAAARVVIPRVTDDLEKQIRRVI